LGSLISPSSVTFVVSVCCSIFSDFLTQYITSILLLHDIQQTPSYTKYNPKVGTLSKRRGHCHIACNSIYSFILERILKNQCIWCLQNSWPTLSINVYVLAYSAKRPSSGQNMYTRNITSLSSFHVGCYAMILRFTVAPSSHYHNSPLSWASAASSAFSSYIKCRPKLRLTRNASRQYTDCGCRPCILNSLQCSSAASDSAEYWNNIKELEGCIDDERQFKTAKCSQSHGDATVLKRFSAITSLFFVIDRKE